MKLKFDENLNDRHARLAQARGHDASTVVEEGLCSATDETVLEVARIEARVLITHLRGRAATVGSLRLHSCAKAGGAGRNCTAVRKNVPAGFYVRSGVCCLVPGV